MSATRYTRKNAPRDWLRTEQWPSPDVTAWDEDDRNRFNTLVEGITQYIAGRTIDSWLRDHEVSWEEFLRAFNRCLARDARGAPIGWNGLVPHSRTGPSVRKAELVQSGRKNRGGLAGAMQKLLCDHPDLKRRFDQYLLENAKRTGSSEAQLRQKSAHQFFIRLCEEDGISASRWPLNAAKKGRGAVRLYIDAFIGDRYDDVVGTQFGQRAAAKAKTGTGHFSRLTATRFYDVVELDEHSAHFMGSVGIRTESGMRWMPLGRLTVIAVVDRKGAVLAVTVICRREANADDILDLLNATFGNAPTYRYSSDIYAGQAGGFPVDLGDPFNRCAFNQLLVDSALAHLAAPIIGRARDIGGFDVNLGPVGRFERRPFVEGAFHALERLGFHRLKTTTGTGPHDPKRQSPEKAAMDATIDLDSLIDLIMAQFADANSRTGKPNFARSHLDCLRDLATEGNEFGMIFPVLPPPQLGQPSLNVSVVPVRVRGSQVKGRRPSVYFEEETYVGTTLANRWDLIGKTLLAHVRRANIQTIEIRTGDGELIDTLTVSGRWRHSPHTLETRRHINWLIRTAQINVRYDEDPVHVHQKMVGELAAKPSGKGRGAGKSMVAAHAEQTRAANAEASKASEEALQKALADVREAALEPNEYVDKRRWRMDDLGALNGG